MFSVVKHIFEMENGFPICLCPLLSNGFLKFLSFDHSRFFFFFLSTIDLKCWLTKMGIIKDKRSREAA